MCDYSLQTIRSRPAKVDDKLVVHNWGTGTCGFASCDDLSTAVCLIPGTELAFEKPIESHRDVMTSFYEAAAEVMLGVKHETSSVAIFRQVHKEHERMHHDALELPNGKMLMLTHLKVGLCATVLQLPAAPKTKQEVEEQKRAVFV